MGRGVVSWLKGKMVGGGVGERGWLRGKMVGWVVGWSWVGLTESEWKRGW